MTETNPPEWTDEFGANICELPDYLIETAVKSWASENNNVDWIISGLDIDYDRVVSSFKDPLAAAIIMAHAKEFHTVEIDMGTFGVTLKSRWLLDAQLGVSGDDVTAFRRISFSCFSEELVEDIMRDNNEIVQSYHNSHRENLKDLRAFASAILSALDETPFK